MLHVGNIFIFLDAVQRAHDGKWVLKLNDSPFLVGESGGKKSKTTPNMFFSSECLAVRPVRQPMMVRSTDG